MLLDTGIGYFDLFSIAAWTFFQGPPFIASIPWSVNLLAALPLLMPLAQHVM